MTKTLKQRPIDTLKDLRHIANMMICDARDGRYFESKESNELHRDMSRNYARFDRMLMHVEQHIKHLEKNQPASGD